MKNPNSEGGGKRKSKYFSVFTIITFLIMFLVSASTLTIGIYLLYTNFQFEEYPEINEYQHTKIGGSQNHPVTVGVVTFPRFLDEDEIVSYTDDLGNLNIISNFGSGEYKCTGSCVCEAEEEGNRRRSSSVIYRGLMLVLMSTTAVVAMKTAEMSFLDDCLKRFKDRCTDKIKATVDSCLGSEERKKEDFHCHGKCMENKSLYLEEKIKDSKTFGCENFFMEGGVTVEGGVSKLESLASKKFKKEQLDLYCKMKSERWYHFKSASAMDGSRVELMHKDFLCTGGVASKDFIHCVPR